MTKQAWSAALHKWLQKAQKYQFAVLILLAGVVLMLLPVGKEAKAPEEGEETVETTLDDCDALETRLEELLGQIEGAGKVRVLLSLESGPAVTYQEDVIKNREGENQELRKETVFASSGGSETPVVVMTTYPRYKRAVVVCQGADSPAVKLCIVQAVYSITGLGSDKITVVRMKG